MSFTTTRLRPQFDQVQLLNRQGRLPEAQQLSQQILAARASSVDDLYCQATLMLQWNRLSDALTLLDQARELGPATPEILVDRGVTLKLLGRGEEAVESCREALALSPRFAPAHLIWGESLRSLGRDEEALAQFDAALAAAPDFLPARNSRADLLTALGRADEALAELQQMLRDAPRDAALQNHFGLALAERERFGDAITAFDQAVALAPREASFWHNRGVALFNAERYDEAVESYERALAINPGLFVTMSNRANTLQELLRLDEAMTAHDRVVTDWPDFVSGHWNRSQGRMLQGDWLEGLKEFEWRKHLPETQYEYVIRDGDEWTGAEDLQGKTLLIHAEQGLGDTIHFARYAALAQERGARVVLAVQPCLVKLLSDGLLPPADAVVDKHGELPAHDRHIPSMSLPLAFGTTTENAPARVPYLKTDAARVTRWKKVLGEDGFKIGVCWRGGRSGNDMGRTFPLALLAPIAALPGVRLISLQKGEGEAQLKTLPPGMSVETLADFDEGPDAFLDTAAVMENLDLVISCDTGIAHLAGALARPLWMATKLVPEWRWLLHRSDSVWYPSARLFRQQAPGDWSKVFADMEDELRKLLKDKA